jgi:hypothetical protein
MANLDDYVDARVAIAAAVGAALFSPEARRFLRRGLVLTLSGAMLAGDTLAGFARGVARGVRQAAAQGEPEAKPGRDGAV